MFSEPKTGDPLLGKSQSNFYSMWVAPGIKLMVSHLKIRLFLATEPSLELP